MTKEKKEGILSKYFTFVENLIDWSGGGIMFLLLMIACATIIPFCGVYGGTFIFYIGLILYFIGIEISYFQFIKTRLKDRGYINDSNKFEFKVGAIGTSLHLVSTFYLVPFYTYRAIRYHLKTIFDILYPNGFILIGSITLIVLWFIINAKIADRMEEKYQTEIEKKRRKEEKENNKKKGKKK